MILEGHETQGGLWGSGGGGGWGVTQQRPALADVISVRMSFPSLSPSKPQHGIGLPEPSARLQGKGRWA